MTTRSFFSEKKRGFRRRQPSENSSLGAKLAFSYSIFLLLCLILGVILYGSSTSNARENFWQQRTVRLESSVAVMDNYLGSLDTYTRQLVNDSTFVRFANMNGIEDYGFISTAYKVRESLKTRMYILSSFPVRESHIYLKKLGYVISGSQFTEVYQFYRDYRIFRMDQYDNWLESLDSVGGEERNIDTAIYTGISGHYSLVRNIDDLIPRSIPAVIWFEWDTDSLTRLFLPEDYGSETLLVARAGDGEAQLILHTADADLSQAAALLAYTPEEGKEAQLGDMHVLQSTSPRTGWTYLLALPQALVAQELGNYDMLFAAIMILALLGGGAVVATIVRSNMYVIGRLDTQLQQAEGDKALLREELDSRREDLCAAYMRRILSGHVGSDQEFAYIMRYLGLEGATRYVVLFCVAYSQDNTTPDPSELHILLSEELPAHLEGKYPLHYYATLDQCYVILAAYDDTVIDPLMDLQKRVLSLHERLTAKYSLWFFAGVGAPCTQPSALWESYEQARTAARYTAKQHIFLPYEAMRKDTQSVYYPIEISAKLLHFISTGNKMQVSKMFSLIHRENVVERSLPVNLLDFLLSDIKNTLLKARFSVVVSSPEEEEALAQIDRLLGGQATFSLCENIALTLCDFFSETAEPSDPIPEVKAYLVDNFTDPSMCLSKLSERFHISESYLSHLFKEKTGQNFSVYLEDLRLNEAVKRLQETNRDGSRKSLNVNMLYMELGYNNATSFRRAFKKRFGITPSDMRERAGRK